jgi:hypothetical protein
MTVAELPRALLREDLASASGRDVPHAAGHMFVSDLKLTQLAHGTR